MQATMFVQRIVGYRLKDLVTQQSIVIATLVILQDTESLYEHNMFFFQTVHIGSKFLLE